MKGCYQCPRKCGADRTSKAGACGCTDTVKVAKYMVHMWEEPCVSSEKGSGCIFFSGCPLGCVYCQNKEISHGLKGEEISILRLSQIMLELQDKGVNNINLVTPTHFSSQIRQAIDLIRDKLKIPVIYNTSGYESPEEILKMADYVDVFLTDIKYYSPDASLKYSKAKDYYKVAKEALLAMLSIQPKVAFEESGLIKKGVIVRHLVLPTLRKDSIKILEDLRDSIDISSIKLSLMSQYTPDFCPDEFKELKRKITGFEYDSVLNRAIELGYDGYFQDRSSSSRRYTPEF